MTKPLGASGVAWVVMLGLGMVLSACNEEEHTRQLAELQAEADKRVQEVEKAARERAAELEKQVESLKADVAAAAEKAKAEAEELTSKAQASVEEAEKETEKALERARIAYKGEAKARYQALNNDLAKVTSQARKIPAKSKDAYNKIIKTILSLQKDISKDIAAYDKATLETLTETKRKLDKDLARYKANVKAAKAKVPGA